MFTKLFFNALIVPTFIGALLAASEGIELSQESNQADRLFEAGLYESAISIYERCLPKQNHLKKKLAQAYLANQDYTKIILLLDSAALKSDEAIILGKAYSKLGWHAEACELFVKALLAQPLNSAARYELAHSLFELGHTKEAQLHFEALVSQTGPFQTLSQFNLAKIFLIDAPQKSNAILDQIQSSLAPDDVLHYEINYLRGMAAFASQDYAAAIRLFEHALPINAADTVEWATDVLQKLAVAHLEHSKDLNQSEKKQHLNRSKFYLEKICTQKNDAKSLLELANVECLLFKNFQDEAAKARIDQLFSDPILNNLESKLTLLILKTQIEPSFEQRKTYFSQITSKAFEKAEGYSRGWYLRALNELNEAKIESNSPRSQELLQQAFNSFATYLDLPAINETELLSAINQMEEIAIKLESADLLASLLKQVDHLKTTFSHLDTALAHVAIVLAEMNVDPINDEIAEKQILNLITHSSNCTDDVQFLYGSYLFKKYQYEKADQAFAQIIENHPDSKLIGDAWFWRSSCQTKLNNPLKSQEYKKIVFEQYPFSIYAAEAYFNFFSFQEYLQGHKKAIRHLQAFEEKFPKSPFLIPAYYLLALDLKKDRKSETGRWISKKNLTGAIEHFYKTETLFDQLSISETQKPYFAKIKEQATLERAKTNMEIADDSQGTKRQIYLEYAQEVLEPLCHSENATTAQVLEEACFCLAQIHFKLGHNTAAEELLTNLLQKYQTAKITRGYYLALIWYEKAKLAMQKKEYEQALSYYLAAEDTSRGKLLPSDQRLTLWIDLSYCYRAMNDGDNALLTLSKVVNEDVISALRIKAMILRAEVYEEQGRRELARRQLETASRKGGEWAKQAKKRLIENYGYPSIS